MKTSLMIQRIGRMFRDFNKNKSNKEVVSINGLEWNKEDKWLENRN